MVAMDPGQRQTGSSKIPENRERLLHAQLIKLEAISPRSFGVPDGIGLVFFFFFFFFCFFFGFRYAGWAAVAVGPNYFVCEIYV